MAIPKRAFEITIKVAGDSYRDLRDNVLAAINDLEEAHDHERLPDVVVGGSRGSYHITSRHDPSMTHERYHEELKTFLSEKMQKP